MGEILPIFLFNGFWIILFAINYYYQRKNRRYADELLSNIPIEYNKQIKANAYRILINRIIWGVFFILEIICKSLKTTADDFVRFKSLVIVCSIFFIIWGILEFRWEISRIKNPRQVNS